MGDPTEGVELSTGAVLAL